MTTTRWWVVSDAPASGREQMATDEALLDLARESHDVWLRFYRFSPPALSVGRGQPLSGIYRPGVAEIGADLVRRPSGGSAVLHDDELTYALAAPLGVVPGDVTESYRQIAEALLIALKKLGVAAELAGPEAAPAGRGRAANCFVAPSAFELTIGGKKAVGSAQVRRRGGLLQHGALARTLDFERWSACFSAPGPARLGWQTQMEARATGLFQHWPKATRPSDLAIEQAVVAGFSERFAVELKPVSLPVETREAAWAALSVPDRFAI